jgi:tight adherence protein B
MTLDPGNIALIAAVVTAIAITLLVWAVADIGSNGLARYRRLFTERTNVSLRELFVFVDPKRLFALNLALILLVAMLTWVATHSALLGVLFGVTASALPNLALRWLRRRRLETLEQQLPDALLMLAGGLKAGVGLNQAIGQLVREAQPPISQELDVLLREQRLGVSMDEALDNLHQRVPLQSVTLVVAGGGLASQAGG